MLGSSVEIEWAREDRGCDYLISDERIAGEPETWQGWELADTEDVIVLEGSAPDDLAKAVENTTIYETRWPHEVEQTTVVDARVDYEVMTAYYSDEPPEDKAEPIGHRESEELLENRGRNDVPMSALEDAWWFPLKDECGFVFEQEDSEGETYNTYRTVRNLSEEELALVNGEIPSLDDDGEREMGLREMADRINENSRLYERQSQYVAAIIEGADGFTEIRDRINEIEDEDVTYNDVSTPYYRMIDKQEEIAWTVIHVWPHLYEEHRTEEMERILDALDGEASPRNPEWLLDDTK